MDEPKGRHAGDFTLPATSGYVGRRRAELATGPGPACPACQGTGRNMVGQDCQRCWGTGLPDFRVATP
jgi:DnaJ-class molecular chaperone